MKKNKIKIFSIIVLFFIVAILVVPKTFASNSANLFETVEYSEDYKNWLELSEEEKQKVMQPRRYDVLNTKAISKSPLYRINLLGASLNKRFSLKDIIPSNLYIRNQMQTNSCWAFAAISSLETNMAMANYKRGINTGKVYDYSERHMEYATSRIFANNVQNEIGYNRNVGSGGHWLFAESYLTNGSGAINEEEMPFENNENIVNISEIQNKTVSTQVYDTIDFPDYRYEIEENKAEIMNQIKQHIQNYGSVYASMHGATSSTTMFECYNNETGAKYCNSTMFHGADHAVSIIGWDDEYSIENFAEGARPSHKGAWIIRNSWGERKEYNLQELKEEIFNAYESQCIASGWTEASLIPNEWIEQNGYTIENDIAYIKIGDNGLMYVSYEDVNVSKTLYGIIKAEDSIEYDNIYQYDKYYPAYHITYNGSNIMLCNVFDKKTSGAEYLTQVSLYAPETYTCKVYVNPNGLSKEKSDLQLVSLKAGETETFNAGYHTLEFAKPIEIKGSSFTVVIEIQGTRYNSINVKLEVPIGEGAEDWDFVTIENGKCFIAGGNDFENCEWYDLSRLSQVKASLLNGDSTIKAFTTTSLTDESLKNIEIVTPPTKTSYFEGENFDKTGMVVKANYNSKTNPSVILDSSSYNITNGTNLKVGQTSVTISFENKSVEQTITVEKNSVTELKIKNPPNKTEYKEGQDFDRTGMIVEATYKDGTTKEITNYEIENEKNLNTEQTKLIISFEGKTVEQEIRVIPNPLIEIQITKQPDKTKYIVGQNFDKTGMIVTGKYLDESTQEIKNYTIENGTNLSIGQTEIIIKYKEKTVTQPITVEEKTITGIAIENMPTKLTYIQNVEDIDLTGGSLKISYNDGTTENVSMTSEEVTISGFSNSELGEITITLTYQGKTANFEVEIIEEAKAENSTINSANCAIKRVQAYYYTDKTKKEYTLINIEINNISRSLINDKVEYYYYLSTNKNEQNIENWIKITEDQVSKDKLQFTIDSRNVSNYNEISGENVIYLYIKEVATKGGNQSVAVSNSMRLETDNNIEVYVDNVKKQDSQLNDIDKEEGKKDDTIASGKLPNAGLKITIMIILIVIIGVAIIAYIRYKNLSKYIR